MTPIRWWALLTVAAIAFAGTEAQAASKNKTSDATKAHAALVSKTYPVADLVGAGECADDAELLVKFVKHAVKPDSWQGHGGTATVEYSPLGKALVIQQTPAVHAQLACLLKALVKLQADGARRAEKQVQCSGLKTIDIGSAATMSSQSVMQAACPAPPAPMCCPTAKSSCKQYGHFVMDDIKVNAMGVSTTIKKIKFMYKGDGIEADVAKCAMTNGESEHKGDLEKLMNQVSELVEAQKAKKEEKKVQTLPECGCVGEACHKSPAKADCSAKPDFCPAASCCPTPCVPACSSCSPCCPAPCAACPKCDKDVTKCKCEDKTEKKGKCEDKKKVDDEVDAIR